MLYDRQANCCLQSKTDKPVRYARAPATNAAGAQEIKLGGVPAFICDLITSVGLLAPPCGGTDTLGYMVKPHGQLVLVSSTPYNAYTPSLSTS